MKLKLTPYTHFRTTVGLAFLAMVTVLFVNACKKELLSGAESPTPEMLNKAKSFYSQQTTSLPKISSANQGGAGENTYNQELEEKKAPIWNEAKMEKTADGRTLMTVPLNKHSLDNKAIDYTRKYVFEERNGNITEGKIIEVIGATELIGEKGESTVTRYKDKQIAGFSGAVISYDLNYRYLEGHHYQAGRQVPSMVRIRAKLPETKATGSKGKLASANMPNKISYEIGNDGQTQTCTNWYMVTSYYDQYGDFMYSTETFLGITCSGPTGPVGPPPVGGGSTEIVRYDCAMEPNGEAYEADCGCIGGSTGIEACPKEVLDSVQNPCIKAQLNLARTAKTTILTMLNSTFGGTVQFEDLSLTFKDVTTLPDSISGDAGRASATSIYFDIRLNKNKLPDYSKEYILSTIYHEILHAYLYSKLTKGPDGKYNISTQHEDMANDYLILMTGALKIAFPNISDQEAWALSWGGLEGTNLYDKKLSQAQKNLISDINRRHTNKSAPDKQGTYCTP